MKRAKKLDAEYMWEFVRMQYMRDDIQINRMDDGDFDVFCDGASPMDGILMIYLDAPHYAKSHMERDPDYKWQWCPIFQ